MRGFKGFYPPLLVGLVFLVSSQVTQAQLTPLNFVYTGSGSQSDALKFSHEAGFLGSAAWT